MAVRNKNRQKVGEKTIGIMNETYFRLDKQEFPPFCTKNGNVKHKLLIIAS